jgi:DegV family protein with EDD domain
MRIIVDSTADVSAKIAEKITVVPLTIFFGEEEFVDGVTISHRQFYEKLVEGDTLPTTSQVTPQAFADAFAKAVEEGDEVVVLTVSSLLSGTYQSAVLAAAEFPGRIHVVDSQTVAIGLGILAEMAVRWMEEGCDAATVATRLTKERGKVRMLAMLDTLEYLKRGGRISKTVAFAGGLLSIKPVVCIREGKIEILGKARGSRQGNNLLVQEIEKAGGVDFTKPLLLGYTGLSDVLLEKYMQDSAQLWEAYKEDLPVSLVSSVVGTHVGPGAVAVAFFAAE